MKFFRFSSIAGKCENFLHKLFAGFCRFGLLNTYLRIICKGLLQRAQLVLHYEEPRRFAEVLVKEISGEDKSSKF
jgi:hypothetical protein